MIYFQNKQTENTPTPASPLSDAHTQCKTRAYFYTDRHNTITHKNTAHTVMDSWLNCKQLFCKYFPCWFFIAAPQVENIQKHTVCSEQPDFNIFTNIYDILVRTCCPDCKIFNIFKINLCVK